VSSLSGAVFSSYKCDGCDHRFARNAPFKGMKYGYPSYFDAVRHSVGTTYGMAKEYLAFYAILIR